MIWKYVTHKYRFDQEFSVNIKIYPYEVIAKLDLVTLKDGSIGQAIEVLVTEQSKVYKIRKLDNDQVVYFDETKVELKRTHLRNFLTKLFAR